MRTARVSNVTRGVELAGEARIADTHWTRLRGLLGRLEPEPGEGLLLRPCRGVHMWGMRYPLDVVFADEADRVVAAYAELQPGARTSRHADAAWALELPAGTLAASRTQVGDELRREIASRASPAPSTRRRTPERA